MQLVSALIPVAAAAHAATPAAATAAAFSIAASRTAAAAVLLPPTADAASSRAHDSGATVGELALWRSPLQVPWHRYCLANPS